MEEIKATSMDLFGQAILDRFNGGKEPFYFIFNGVKRERSLDRYLRSPDELNEIEKKLIELACGKILDVGCGTGNYIDKLQEKGSVIAIDISNKVIETAHRMGNLSCVQADIFSYNPNTTFDTITFLENNFGMATSTKKVVTLIKKLKSLLSREGQVLLMQRDIEKPDFIVNTITIEYKNIQKNFNWAHSSKNYLEKCFTREGLKFDEVLRLDLDAKQDWYLARITT